MLHRFLTKELSSKKKRVKINPNVNVSKDEPSSEFLMSSPNIKESLNNPSCFLQRRNSMRTNTVDFTINSTINAENFSVIIENKNKRIAELERKLHQISQLIMDLYEKMRNSLIIDEVFESFFFYI